MFGKLIISADLKVLTGLHIGGSGGFSVIGAVDSPVVRDPRTGSPIIPGSSLKGKLRTLLVKSLSEREVPQDPSDDPEEVRRLFGSTGNNRVPPIMGRLQFVDAFMSNFDELDKIGVTEIKTENTINRRTGSSSNMRQIERVVSGAVFDVRIVYNVTNLDELVEDIENLARAIKLLQLDYLGGHGTRGSGRVSIENIQIKTYDCEIDEVLKNDVLGKLKEVESYGILSV